LRQRPGKADDLAVDRCHDRHRPRLLVVVADELSLLLDGHLEFTGLVVQKIALRVRPRQEPAELLSR